MTGAGRRAAARPLTSGQLCTALIGLVCAVVLIVTTLPAVIESRDAAGRETEPRGTAAGTEAPSTSGPLTASDLFVRVATEGTDPTAQGFTDAVQGLEDSTFPGLLGGTFEQDKTDFDDGLRSVSVADACHCYEPAGDPSYLDDVS